MFMGMAVGNSSYCKLIWLVLKLAKVFLYLVLLQVIVFLFFTVANLTYTLSYKNILQVGWMTIANECFGLCGSRGYCAGEFASSGFCGRNESDHSMNL